MRNSKFGLRAFGLALMAALGLMAFSAVAAQAEETLSDGGKAANFLVKLETSLATLGVTFKINQVGTGTLLVPGRVDILCEEGSGTGEFHNSQDALATVTFKKCTPWQPVTILGNPHVTKVACSVKEPIVAKALVLPKKHNGEPFILLEPQEGELFTTVFLEEPGCPLTKENPVKGSVVLLLDSEDAVSQLLLASHTIQKLFQTSATLGDHLKYGNFEAYLDGHATAELTDVNHVNLTFGVC